MKNKTQFISRCRVGAQVLAVGVGLVMPGMARAENFVKNPDFEEPLGPDNWTVVYTGVKGGGPNAPTNCGPCDFMIAGRTIMAGMRTSGESRCTFGGHFAPNHNGLMHAYFKQTVSGLKPGATYAVSAWMAQSTRNSKFQARFQVYLEALGGPDLAVSKTSSYVTNNIARNPDNWKMYAVTSTASERGQVEVRLHFNKIGTTPYWEWRNVNACYDRVSVTPKAD